MRILHVADIHYRLDWFDWISQQAGNYDVLVVAGDLLNMDSLEATPLPQQAHIVCDWLKTLPNPAVVCTGNHDVWLTEARVKTDIFAEGGWLQSCKREGLVVDEQDAAIYSEHFAAVKWGCADWPDSTTIVVCHAPPEWTRISKNSKGVDWGNFEISVRIQEKHPKYVLSGHVHQAMDWMATEGASYCFNPGFAWKALVPNHIIIDTTKKIACWHSNSRGRESRRLDDSRR